MPTAWEPCPGKVNAAVIGVPKMLEIPEVAPKDMAKTVVSSRWTVPGRPIDPAFWDTARNPG
jgi:hypothetical protein